MNLASCEKFLGFVEEARMTVKFPAEAVSYYESIKAQYEAEKDKPPFTENGLVILEYMQGQAGKMLTAKEIAEGLGWATRTVSGSIRKLTQDGYLIKSDENSKFIVYKITEKGINCNVDDFKINNEE